MQKKSIIRVLSIVLLLLVIPLVGNLFVEGWNWSLGDFAFAGALLSITGLLLELAFRKFSSTHRIIAMTIIVLVFLFIWVELAVGILDKLF